MTPVTPASESHAPTTDRPVTAIDTWRDAWDVHGATVLRSAAAIGIGVDEALACVVPAMADPRAPFDPLEAMISALTIGRRRRDRRLVEAAPHASDGSAGRESVPFEVLQKLSVALPPSTVAPHAHATDRPMLSRRRPGLQRFVMATVALTAVVVGGVVGFAVVVHHQRLGDVRPTNVPLFGPLNPDALDGWGVIRSEASVPSPIAQFVTLVQDFADPTGAHRLRLETTPRFVHAFADVNLGDFRGGPIDWIAPDSVRHLENRDVSIAEFSEPGTRIAGSWVTSDTRVGIESAGIPEATLLVVLDQLVQRDPQGLRGFSLDPRVSNLSVQHESSRKSPATTQHTQWIVLHDQGDVGIVTIAVSTSNWHRPAPFAPSEPPFGPRPSDSLTLRAGVVASRSSESDRRFLTYSWQEQGAMVWATASGTVESTWPARVDTLIRSIGPVDAATWRRFDRIVEQQTAAAALVDAVTVGPLALTIRDHRDDDPLSYGVCVKTRCATWQTATKAELPWTAELIVDGHWWHLERFGALAERTDPYWLMSPHVVQPPSFTYEGPLHTTWRATDFGTVVQAARTSEQDGVFLRPRRGESITDRS